MYTVEDEKKEAVQKMQMFFGADFNDDVEDTTLWLLRQGWDVCGKNIRFSIFCCYHSMFFGFDTEWLAKISDRHSLGKLA